MLEMKLTKVKFVKLDACNIYLLICKSFVIFTRADSKFVKINVCTISDHTTFPKTNRKKPEQTITVYDPIYEFQVPHPIDAREGGI